MLNFKIGDKFIDGTTFNNIINAYYFDKDLRNLLRGMLETVEVAFRTHIAYLIAHKYGPLGYKDPKNFLNKYYHDRMMKSLLEEISRSNEVFVYHYKRKYKGIFPVWVVMELTSFSQLSKIYKNLKKADQNEIAYKNYGVKGDYVNTWLHTLSVIRNICAHHGRLYNRQLTINPKLFIVYRKRNIDGKTLFAVLLVLGRLLNTNDNWNLFVNEVDSLISHYSIDYSLIGFPEDWKVLLLKQ